MTSKRFTTTWTSEDYVQYRLYIIPSDADYSSGSTDQVLPDDFLLRDMKLETSIGELPAGLQSQVLKFSVNLASCQGTAELNNLREQLLKGTTTQLTPKNADGSEYLVNENFGYHEAPTLEQRQFDVFNTFILLYNDGFGFTPNDWKVAFIGCQKYASENELELTSLQNVIKFSIEAHDITRCIGETIDQNIWKVALRAKDEMINLSSTLTKSETEEYRHYLLGKDYYFDRDYDNPKNVVDVLDGRFWSYVSTFDRLGQKMTTMLSAYFRTILRKNTATFSIPQLFEKTILFKKEDGTTYLDENYLCYVAEIWESVKGSPVRLVSGAHVDQKMFGQFTNFYELLKMLVENSLEIFVPTYTWSNGSPDQYTLTLTSSFPLAATSGSTVEFNQDNTYSSFKMKILSESLRYASLSVTSVTGDSDTTEFIWGEKGTSNDNSKEMKLMFHNLTVLTDRKTDERIYAVWDNQNMSKVRRSVNSGTILYFDDSTPHLPRKVHPEVSIIFDADAVMNFFTRAVPILPTETPDAELLLLYEQQFSGLPTTIAYALVQLFGNRKQAETTLTSRFINIKSSDIGKRCKVNLNNYNSLLEKIYNANIVKGMLMEASHDVWQGTNEITIRIDAET